VKYRRDTPIGENLKDGEPFFLLRGQDLLAVPALMHYTRLAQNSAPDVAQEMNAIVVQFMEYQAEHPTDVKVPDL
jgi:hypothetical protein